MFERTYSGKSTDQVITEVDRRYNFSPCELNTLARLVRNDQTHHDLYQKIVALQIEQMIVLRYAEQGIEVTVEPRFGQGIWDMPFEGTPLRDVLNDPEKKQRLLQELGLYT